MIEHDRLPPQNLEAEFGVLGSILLDDSMLHEVEPLLAPGDFYRDSHGEIYAAMLSLHHLGRPVDALTLIDELERRGEFEKVGGDDTIRKILEAPPHADNAAYYAQIVRQKAISRDLIGFANGVIRDGYSNQFSADELAERAEKALFALTRSRASSDLSSAAEAVADSVYRLSCRDEGVKPGLATGFRDFDQMTGGMMGGHMVVVAARPSIGKAQPLDAKIMTPRGFVDMGSIRVGDEVIGSDGKPCRVTGVFPQGDLPVFRVTMTDGGSTECCEEHLWFTQTRNERRLGIGGSVKSLKRIGMTLARDGSSPNHAIPVHGAVEFSARPRPDIDPYAMGVLIGDGCFRSESIGLSNSEADVVRRLAELLPIGDELAMGDDGLNHRIRRHRRTNGPSFTREFLSGYGLYGLRSKEKFIPDDYLLGSPECRIAILRGLMDTDGSVTSMGASVEFPTSSPRLAKGVEFLVRSLGGVVSVGSRIPAYTYRGERRRGSESFRLIAAFPSGLVPVSSEKHLARWKWKGPRYRRSIRSIEPAGFKPCQCIKVDSPDQLYIADDFIVTHNTSWAMNVAEHVALGGTGVLFVSLEMGRGELGDRLICGRTGIEGQRYMHSLRLLDGDRLAIRRAAEDLSPIPLHIDDSSSQTVSRIASNARRLRSLSGPGRAGLVVVDYLQLVSPEDGRAGAPRHEQVASMSKSMKQLARELDVPVMVVCQLNREVERREDKRPTMADLRECVAGDQMVYDSATGGMRRVDECVARPVPVYGIRESDASAVERGVASPFWSTGVRPVFRLRTRSGRAIRCTANHPLLTAGGWRRLDEIGVGSRIAVPRRLPEPSPANPGAALDVDEARLLGYLICDGSYLEGRSVGYVKGDHSMVDEVCRIALDRFGIVARDHACPGDSRQVELTGPRLGPGGNPLINWLRGLGIHGQKSDRKTIPDALLASPNRVVAQFLATLWAGDGSIVPRKTGGWVLKFPSTSMTLLHQVQMLLLRFGIVSLLGRPGRNSKSTVDIATLSIADSGEVVRFAETFDLPGYKGVRLRDAAEDCRELGENAHVDRLPIEVTGMVFAESRAAGVSWSKLGYRCQGKEMHRSALAAVADRLGSDRLKSIARADVLWDEVTSIDPDGECETFDTRVPGLHNFVVGGVFAHNSGAIEQDANLVLLLHRPEFYDREDRPGEADLIVAKNRNGPTGTVRLAFAKATTRFSDFAHHHAADEAVDHPF